MTKSLLLIMGALSLTSCSMIHSLQRNQQAVDTSTCTIYENIAAIEDANQKIAENSRTLGEINEVLKKAGER